MRMGTWQRSELTSRCPRLFGRVWRSRTFYTANLTHDSFSITGTAREYLTDRAQFVRVWSESSVVTNCSCGMPQGSVLGPLFFVAYISPSAKITKKFNVLHNQYADDTQLYVVEKGVNWCSQQPAKLPCCRSHVIHSEWTNHQPRQIGGGTPMHSTAIKSSCTAAERRECCRLCCPIRRHRFVLRITLNTRWQHLCLKIRSTGSPAYLLPAVRNYILHDTYGHHLNSFFPNLV